MDKKPLLSGFHARGVLPHIKKEGAAYFVTFRLAGTLPRQILLQLKAERDAITANALASRRPLTWQEQEELFRWYSFRVDKYLDAGHGDCWMGKPEIADLVAGALQHHAESCARGSASVSRMDIKRVFEKLEGVQCPRNKPAVETDRDFLAEGIL